MKHTQRMKLTSPILALFVCGAMVAPSSAQTQTPASPESVVVKTAQTAASLRDLWIGHGFWVREVAAETLTGNSAGAQNAENQAVANAKLIAASIEPFYGKAASEKLFGLLAGHYSGVKGYLEAADKGSQEKQDAAQKAMVANAEDIALFLSGANPYLPHEALRSMLLAHGGHHIQQIQQLKSKEYAQEAQTWEAMKNHMYAIADALATALAKQFPEKFSA